MDTYKNDADVYLELGLKSAIVASGPMRTTAVPGCVRRSSRP